LGGVLTWRSRTTRADAIVVGIDPGSVAVRVVIGAIEPDADDPDRAIRLLGIGEAPSQGIRRGAVADPARLGTAVRAAISQAERAAGHRVLGAYFAAPLPFLTAQKRRGRVLLDSPSAMSALNFRETDAAAIWKDVAEQAGVRLVGVIPSVVAASAAVTLPDEHAGGVALLECGAEHTSVAFFRGGTLQRLGAVPVGGDHITRDLAKLLGLDPVDAERLKFEIGHGRRAAEDMEVMARGTDGLRKSVPVALVVGIVAARIDQMLGHVNEMMRPVLPAAGTCSAVLCGGGAGLAGIAHAARAGLGMPVRVAGAWGFAGPRKAQSPGYAAALGLIRWRVTVQLPRAARVYTVANSRAGVLNSENSAVRTGQTRWQAWLREFLP
jgi:cell division protein FtsA